MLSKEKYQKILIGESLFPDFKHMTSTYEGL